MTDVAIDRTRGRWPVRLAVAAAVAVVILGAVLGARFGFDTTTVDSPLIGQAVPEQALPLLEGDDEVHIPDDVAGDVLVVNFWASWCVPCRVEHPALVRTAERYQDQGVTFLGIVYQDTESGAVDFLDELGRGYDHVTDPGDRAAIDFGVFGIPETFVIDRDATVAAKIIGEVDEQTLADVIEDVLAGREPGSISGGESWGQPGG